MRLDYAALTPEPAQHLFAISAAVRHSALSGTVRELTAVYISQLNGCAHCIAVHWEKALKEGVSKRQLQLLPALDEAVRGDGVGVYDSAESCALQVARRLTVTPANGVSADLWQTAQATFGEETLMWLIQHILLMNSWNRLSIALEIAPPQDST